jgi:hypothetical protein
MVNALTCVGHKGQDRQRPRPPPHGLSATNNFTTISGRSRALEHWKAGFGSVSAKLAGTRKVSNLFPSSPAPRREINLRPIKRAMELSCRALEDCVCIALVYKTNNSCMIRVCRSRVSGHGAFISQPGEKAIPAADPAQYERWARAVHVISHLKRETLHCDRADSL